MIFSFSKLATLHFQNLFVFGKLLQQATHLGDGKLRKITPKKMLCQDMALSQHHVSSTHPGREKKKLHGYFSSCFLNTSSTAQGGGGSFKNRKPIGEIGCCESGMAERIH